MVDVATAAACAAAAAATMAGCCGWLVFIVEDAAMDGVVILYDVGYPKGGAGRTSGEGKKKEGDDVVATDGS